MSQPLYEDYRMVQQSYSDINKLTIKVSELLAEGYVPIGGMGSQLGIILAAVAMTVLPELAREFQEYRMLMFGLMMVLMMIWRPQGLLPMKRRHMELTNG